MNLKNRLIVTLIVFGLGFGMGLRFSVRPERPSPMPLIIQKAVPKTSVQPATEIRTVMDLPDCSTWNISAYCPGPCCCGESADGYTASGHRIEYGDRLVAGPPELGFGTKITIPGYGTTSILDRGGVIKGKRLDVLFFEKSPDPKMTDIEYSHNLALQWGRKHLSVTF